MLDINMQFKKGILFVRLNGILNGDTCFILDNKLTSLIKRNGIKYVLLNLNKITYLDKYGLNIIFKNYINISKLDGKFMIVTNEELFNFDKNIIDNLYQIKNEAIAFNLVRI